MLSATHKKKQSLNYRPHSRQDCQRGMYPYFYGYVRYRDARTNEVPTFLNFSPSKLPKEEAWAASSRARN